MESNPASGTPPVTSTSELGKYIHFLPTFFPATTDNVNSEPQDLQGQSGNDVAFIDDDDDKTALNISIGDAHIRLPLFPEQETFTNPATYSYEETLSCLQRGIDLFWDDDMAARQINAGTDMHDSPQEQNPPQGQNPPQAPSATPDVKPIPQARARGVKRRDLGTSSRAAKRPADRDGQPATKKVKSGESPLPRAAKRPTRRNRQPATEEENSEKPRTLKKLLPKPRLPEPIQPCSISPMAPVPYQQEFQANRGFAYCVDNPALYGANRQPASYCNGTVSTGIQGLYYGSSRTRMGMDPGGVAFSDNASIHRSSYMVPQSQRTMRSTLPTPTSSPGMIPNPMSPQQQQLANGMTMGSTLPSPVSTPGQIPIATENLLPHLNRSMQDSQVGWFPAMTAEVTTNPLPWSTQHSYNPFFGGLQSMRQPAMPTGMGIRGEWTPPVNPSQPEPGHQFTGLHPTMR
ncbi:hypothetical protein FAGAP_7140 [Fusarium agapanthi]|uniref:Uncharacterized protein n=1 Tax=Fusarium agapanthi TaxID=1803897 RepID=A0A9P5B876_9HYPO|nr:hypothetical protein FAGAP_7140 [Fusarium agapanthi]